MPKVPTGLSSLNQIQSTNPTLANIFPARVKLSILDDKTYPELFNNFGEWSSIGCLFFDRINNPNPNPKVDTNSFAKPLFPNQSTIPVNNEVVYIISLPNDNIQSNVNDIAYYYFQPINIWNNAHHNAIPDPINNKSLPESQKQDYQQTEIGVVRRVTDNSTEINLGETFKEKLNIRNLQPYEGDVIHQGRWGQSLRFGSTVTNAKTPNTWSKNGNNGDPITIIRNGQYDDGNDPWIPQIEDINKDISSVYITSKQQIPVGVASSNYKSYTDAPINPTQYKENQIILNSGRLLLNSKTDSILLSSAKTINLNSKESVNIDTKQTIVDSRKILLGDKDAKEPIILGDKFLNDFRDLLQQLIRLNTALTPLGTFAPNVPLESTNLTIRAQEMLSSLSSYKSKKSFTK